MLRSDDVTKNQSSRNGAAIEQRIYRRLPRHSESTINEQDDEAGRPAGNLRGNDPPAGAVFAFTGQQCAGQAKITLAQARAKALQAYPGTITDQGLEKERGGTDLRYSFDIRKGAVTREIGIDARTGRLPENSLEGPHAD